MSATIPVQTEPRYDVHVGVGLLSRVDAFTEDYARRAILADARVEKLHGTELAGLEDLPRLCVAPGEDSKSFDCLERLLEFMAEAQLDRSSCLITFGGGVVGDLGGLAASLFKRGCTVVHAPTTLLAQVDSSVGGKTAINLRAGKNLAGTFHQPRAVFADTSTLSTLAPAELRSGLGEVVKTALIGGEPELQLLEQHAQALLACEAQALQEVISACVRVKARVVASDPTEKGARRTLNLGHTFAHTIEHAAGYGTIPHGVAVAAGLGLALTAARHQGLLEDAALEERTHGLLQSLGLPADVAQLRATYGTPLDCDTLIAGLRHDKKGAVGAPEFVLPARVGDVRLGLPLPGDLLAELFV